MIRARLITTVALVATIACLVWAGNSSAAPPAGGWGQAALTVAHEYWGTDSSPLCSSETVAWNTAPPDWPDRLAAATAPLVADTPCEMWVAAGVPVYTLCVVVVHEFAHWLGYQWGTDPLAITYDGNAAGDEWHPPHIHRCLVLAHGHPSAPW